MERLDIYNTSLPVRENIKLWNQTAKDCYFNGCNCGTCFIFKTYFLGKDEECMMKFYVDYLVKKLGKPKDKN